VFYKIWVEGDDGIKQMSDVFYQEPVDGADATNSEVELQYRNMGFETKLKYIKTGRAEFIGTHFVITNGLCDLSVPWTPAIQRYMIKLGVSVSADPSFEANVSRAASLASMFGGKIECFAFMFLKLMEDMVSSQLYNGEVLISTKPYTLESRAFGDITVPLQQLVDSSRSRITVPYPTVQNQVRMIENSFEMAPGSFTVSDLMKLSQLGEIISSDMTDEVAYGYLPVVFR